MNKTLRVAAAQLAEIPSDLTGGICAQSVNTLMVTEGESGKKAAERLLEEIKVDAIRQYSVSRMLVLMRRAAELGCDLIVFPELALTSFFPYFYIASDQLLLRFFEREHIELGPARPLFECAKRLHLSFSFGYAECANPPSDQGNGRRYNTYLLIDKEGNIYKYRKTHIPGFDRPRAGEANFQFERNQFHPSQEGYPVFSVSLLGKNQGVPEARIGMLICHDRRYNAPFLIMGMQKVDIILNGFNTPFNLPFMSALDKNVYRFHYLPLQAQAITEGTFIISSARAGDVFGVRQIAGTCIIDPNGEVLRKTEVLEEQLITAELDLNLCEMVRSQKYWGSRLEPHVLLKELGRLIG